MNKIWEYLGIEPTKDKKEIRKAFAAQSRLHHPEEEPEYFAQLNQAYKEALKGTEEKSGDAPAKGRPETGRISGETMDGGLEEPSSLLLKLEKAREEAIQESMEKGALSGLILLFGNPRQAKKADTWMRYFLSEAFLAEQFKEEFGIGLTAYILKQTVFPWDNLPLGFLQELAIAYAVTPHFAGEEYFEGFTYPKEWYKVSVDNTFPVRKHIADIFNMQGRECDLKNMTSHILHRPANKVRYNAFSDYLALKEMNQKGELTEREQETWQHILGQAQINYIYERNGKMPGMGAYESRSECVVKLYVQWLKDERLPVDTLKFIYKKFAFKDLARSSTRGLYGALKEQVVKQLPDVEEILYGMDGKEQAITRLYRICSRLISDNHNNYDKWIYEETLEIRQQVEAFFAMPEWQALKGDKALFERIYGAARRFVIPRTLALGLLANLEEGDFPEPRRTELMESLLRSLATPDMMKELDYRYERTFSVEELQIGSRDFWEYFLMRGFGYRHMRIRGDWESGMIYEKDGECYLPAYINYIYAPSRAWQRVFTGFDEEWERIETPVRRACGLPDGRRLWVEFHYHYCQYFVDETPVWEPVLDFPEFCRYVQGIEDPLEFFFLLAVTAIGEEDRAQARKLIEKWMEQIPVYPFIRPTVARMLAADNDRVPTGPGIMSGEACGRPGNGCPQRTAQPEIFYTEQERFCFQVVAWENEIQVFRQADFGWEDRIFRCMECGWQKFLLPGEIMRELAEQFPASREERRELALKVLGALRQPRPVLREAIDVAGMDYLQKAEAILAAMNYRESPEGYCVFRYGELKKRRHDRVFYGAKVPFGFDVNIHSTEYGRNMEFHMSVLNTRIKEWKTYAGRFGWGFKYSPQSDFWPACICLGESGDYYAYEAMKMRRSATLAELLAEYFRKDFEGVTELEIYEGLLTVSRLDHRLEYCYGENELRKSVHSGEDTWADTFTVFGGRPMWMEFAGWMDAVLKPGLPPWVNLVEIGLDWEKGGALTLVGTYEKEEEFQEEFLEEGDGEENQEEGYARREDEKELSGEESHLGELYQPQTPFLVWNKGLDESERQVSLNRAIGWYLDTGKYAWVLREANARVIVGSGQVYTEV